MATPKYYAGPDSNSIKFNQSVSDVSILSGQNWLPTLTGNLSKSNISRWYCLDLLGKYNTKSNYKQFHALTFYFRNSNNQKQGAIITSMLPESLTYSIGGVYGNPINMSGGDVVDAIAQAFTSGNVSFQMAINTALVWQKPKTMEIVFKIPIFDDSSSGSHVNYQEAIDLFGEAILPNVARNGTYESVPGPSVVTAISYKSTNGKKQILSETASKQKTKGTKFSEKNLNGESTLWDRISVQVGGLLLLDWCVIKDLKVTFPNTKAMVLHDFTGTHPAQKNEKIGETYKMHLQPLQAELEVTVATVMGVTRATFKDMLYQTETTFSKIEETNKVEVKTTSDGPIVTEQDKLPQDAEMIESNGKNVYVFKDTSGQTYIINDYKGNIPINTEMQSA